MQITTIALGLVAVTLLAAVLRGIHDTGIKIMATQEKIDELKAALEANTSVTDSVVQAFNRFMDEAEEAKDDPEELQALIDGYRANTERLAAAVAASTPAEPGGEATEPGAGEETDPGEDLLDEEE